jgi:hypothetical protein
MTKPPKMAIFANNIPPELWKGKRWILWRWEERKDAQGNKKWTKPPYRITGAPARSNDPTTWANFSQAWNAYDAANSPWDGIGYMLGGDGYVGVDFDDCLDPATGAIDPKVMREVTALNSYTEISPSGKGLKTLCRGILPGKDHHNSHVGIFTRTRYFCITGNVLPDVSPKIENRLEEIAALYREVFGAQEERQEPPAREPVPENGKSKLGDEEILTKARAAKNAAKFNRLWGGDTSDYASHSEADLALCMMLGFWTQDTGQIDRLFRQSGLHRDKWDREDYWQRTIAEALSRSRETYKPKAERNTAPTSLEFPDVLTGLAGDFARLYSSHLEVPAHFFYTAFLACLGLTVADRLTIASEIAPQPRLYVVLLGESADDRKSTAILKTVDFFQHAMGGEHFPVCFGVGSAEGLQKRLEGVNRLLLCFDEFKQFISKCKIETSVLLPCVNTLYESNRYESRTKTSEVYLENAYLSLLAASTIPTYENTWSSQFTDIGFNNRLWLVPGGAERRFSLPAKVPDRERYLLKERLGELLRHVANHGELDLSPEAKELYHSWYMNRPQSVHSKRLDTYAVRFMPLLAVNEFKSEVDAETVKKVIDLCDWQYFVRQLHDPVDADNEVARMEEKMRRVLTAKGGMTERDLKRFTNTTQKGLWFFATAKANLQKAGELGFNRGEKKYFLRREPE